MPGAGHQCDLIQVSSQVSTNRRECCSFTEACPHAGLSLVKRTSLIYASYPADGEAVQLGCRTTEDSVLATRFGVLAITTSGNCQ